MLMLPNYAGYGVFMRYIEYPARLDDVRPSTGIAEL